MKRTFNYISLFVMTASFIFLLLNIDTINSINVNECSMLRSRLSDLGPKLYLIIMVLFTLISFGAFSGTLLAIVVGYFFGIYSGILIMLIGTAYSSIIGYHAGEYLINLMSNSKINKYIEKYSSKLQERTFPFLVLLRLTPIFPYQLINALCGYLKIDKILFIFATLVGVLPATILFVYIGSVGCDYIVQLTDYLKSVGLK